MSDITPTDCTKVLELLARWQAFSELQQRAFAFLAAEAVATGQEFENSTDGATSVLTRMGETASQDELKAETWAVVQKLQAADRSRQGLEQVASVLTTLKTEHATLVDRTLTLGTMPSAEELREGWISALAANVSLADWRRRLVDALHGREPAPAAPIDDDDVLF